MLFVDTNIFLEFLLDQEKSEECKKFLKYAEEKNVELCCSHFSIHSIEAILSSKKKTEALEKFIENLELSENMAVYGTTMNEEKEVIGTERKTSLDFDDALQYFAAKKTGCSAIVSFDAHFDKTDLKRTTPGELLPKSQFGSHPKMKKFLDNEE